MVVVNVVIGSIKLIFKGSMIVFNKTILDVAQCNT